MEPGSQRGLLGREPAAPLPAARRRSREPPRGRQRRGAAEQPDLAPVVDAAADRRGAAIAVPVARRHRVPLSGEPQGRGVPPDARRRSHAGRREPRAQRPVRGARPVALRRAGAGGAVRTDALPADRPAPVLHHAGTVRLLLVPPPGRRARGRGPLLARSDAQLVGVVGHRARPTVARRPRTIPPPVPRPATLVRGEGQADRHGDDLGRDPRPRRRRRRARSA